MQSEKEILISEFEKEMVRYSPDWNTIIEANNITTEVFGKRLKELRKSRGLSQENMGERLSYSKQAISKIEQGKNKKIPVNKLDFISDLFSVSVAYLLGLNNDANIYIGKQQYYFWENPKERYQFIKADVIDKPLMYPMETQGDSIENMLDEVINELKTDYDLVHFLQHIFSVEKRKLKEIHNIIKAIDKIL